jgi:hypothetical protein
VAKLAKLRLDFNGLVVLPREAGETRRLGLLEFLRSFLVGLVSSLRWDVEAGDLNSSSLSIAMQGVEVILLVVRARVDTEALSLSS